jgi:hypothetical protein
MEEAKSHGVLPEDIEAPVAQLPATRSRPGSSGGNRGGSSRERSLESLSTAEVRSLVALQDCAGSVVGRPLLL